MATLIKRILVANPHIYKKTIGVLYNASRNHWNYQYMPGPYPKTPEERAEAAKKYGLTLEEYKTYPEELGYGDYPKMPDIGADSKDPHYPYDSPELKRNFNEPMHINTEIIGEDRYDISMRRRFSLTHQWTWFLTAVLGSFGVFFICENFPVGRPVTAKQLPWQGPHYEFETK